MRTERGKRRRRRRRRSTRNRCESIRVRKQAGATQNAPQMAHPANEEGHVHGLPNVASTGVRERLAPLLKRPHVATHDAPHLVLGRPNHGMWSCPVCQILPRWWIKPGNTSEFSCRSGSCHQRRRPILVHEMQNRVCHLWVPSFDHGQ